MRDIKIIENQKLFAVLSVDKKNNNCATIALRLYDFSFNNNKFLLNNERKLWEDLKKTVSLIPKHLVEELNLKIILFCKHWYISISN